MEFFFGRSHEVVWIYGPEEEIKERCVNDTARGLHLSNQIHWQLCKREPQAVLVCVEAELIFTIFGCNAMTFTSVLVVGVGLNIECVSGDDIDMFLARCLWRHD